MTEPTIPKYPIKHTIIIIIVILVLFIIGMVLCYTWANDLAIHMIYLEQLIRFPTKPLDPNDFI